MSTAGSAPRDGGWVVVADSWFVPAVVGGHREHRGFVDAAVAAGLVAVLVVCTRPDDRPPAVYRAGGHSVPVVLAPRDLRRRHLLDPRAPFVVRSRPTPPGLVAEVAAGGPTAVVAFSYKVHALAHDLARDLAVPAVLRQHNLEAHYHRELARAAGGPRGWLMRWEARRIARDERRLERAGWLRGVADISVTDAAVRRRRTRVPVHHVGPFALGSRVDPPTPRRPEPGRVLFLGALDVATNIHGLRWLTERVWPLVRAHAPGAHLAVVGSGPGPRLRRRLALIEGVELHADVPAVAPWLASAAVAVNPTVSGSGVNIKLVDYLAAGVPTVTTRAAAAGLGLTPRSGLAVADGPAAFAAAVVAMLREPVAADGGVPALDPALDPAHGLAQMRELFS